MAVRQRKRTGLALPSGRGLGATRLEPSLTILYLAVLALWALLMNHAGVPLDVPLLVPVPGGLMLAAPVLTCIVALACAGVGVSYVSRVRGPVRPGPLMVTIMLPTALVLLPYQWLYSQDGCWFALVAALTTGVMLGLVDFPLNRSARGALARGLGAAALVACAAMPWLAAQRAGAVFWTFAPTDAEAATETTAAQAADSLRSSWTSTAIKDRGRLCEAYLSAALDSFGMEGEQLVVRPGPMGQVTRTGDVVTASVATIASPDPSAAIDGLDGVIARARGEATAG